MTDEDPEIEFSKLGGVVERDGVTVDVHIYRIADRTEGWALEVVALDGTSTAWQDLFVTEQNALDEFERTVREDGMIEFLADPDPTVH